MQCQELQFIGTLLKHFFKSILLLHLFTQIHTLSHENTQLYIVFTDVIHPKKIIYFLALVAFLPVKERQETERENGEAKGCIGR